MFADRGFREGAAGLDREEREGAQRLVLGRRRSVEEIFGITRSARSYRRWKLRRPAITSCRGPTARRAPSSPASSPTSRHRLAFEVARAERAFGADPLEHRLDEVGVVAERAVVRCPSGRRRPSRAGSAARARSAAATPRAPSTRRRGPSRSSARHASVEAPIRADERQPVRAVDGRDRVELDGAEPPDRCLDVVRRRRAGTRRVALRARRSSAGSRRADRHAAAVRISGRARGTRGGRSA